MKKKIKLQDLPLLIKKDRKFQVIGGFLLAVIVIALLTPNSRAPRKPRAQTQTTSTGAPGGGEDYKDLVMAFNEDMKSLKTDVHNNSLEIQQTRKQQQEDLQRMTEIFKKLFERVEEQKSYGGGGGTSQVSMHADEVGEVTNELSTLDGMEAGGIESFNVEPPVVAPPPAPATKRFAVVGAGDSVRVKLLAGVNAPTDGTPYPVVFKMIGDVNGPDGQALPLGEARLVAAAQGSLTDSRALFRLTTLNMRYPDGRRHVMEVDGWVVGEDGIRGMSGILIDPIGKAIGGAAMAGVVEGLGNGLAARNVTSNMSALGGSTLTVTGSEGEYAVGHGLGEGSKVWGRMIENRVNKLVPQVKVFSGREGTAVFAKSFKIPGLYEALESDDDSFSSMD